MKLFDKIPIPLLAALALFMAIAPLGAQPHLVAKLSMLISGSLTKPIDIFDLFMHSLFLILFSIRLIRIGLKSNRQL